MKLLVSILQWNLWNNYIKLWTDDDDENDEDDDDDDNDDDDAIDHNYNEYEEIKKCIKTAE